MNEETLDILMKGTILGLIGLTGFLCGRVHYYKKYCKSLEKTCDEAIKQTDDVMELYEEAMKQTDDVMEIYYELVESINPEWAKQIKKEVKKVGFTVLNNEES